MKKNIVSLFAIAILFTGLSVKAQQITNLPPQQTFFNSVIGYISSFDTNSTTFQSNKFEVFFGVDYANSLNTASSIGIEYNINSTFAVDSVTKNAGVAGVLLSEQIGFGIEKVVYDAKFGAFLDAGYDFEFNKPYIEPRFEIKKALTKNTFAGFGLGAKFFIDKSTSSKAVTPTLSAYVGFVL